MITKWVLLIALELGQFQHGGWPDEASCMKEMVRLKKLWGATVLAAECRPYEAKVALGVFRGSRENGNG